MQNRSKIQNEQKPCRIHGGTTRNNILLCKIVPKSKMSKNHAEFMGAQLEIIYYYAKSFQNPKLAKTMQNSWGHNSK